MSAASRNRFANETTRVAAISPAYAGVDRLHDAHGQQDVHRRRFDVTVDGGTCHLTATPGDHADVDKLRDAHEQQVMDRLRAVLPATTWDDLETLRVYAG